MPPTANEATATPPDTAEAAAEAEKEAAGHELEKLARQLELDMKTKAEEDLAMQKLDWEDTLKDPTREGHLGEVQATPMTEAALDLVRHQEDALVREAEEKGLQAFDASLITNDFFGKTARSLSKIEAQRRLHGAGYIFYVSRLSEEQATAENLHSPKEYEFLAQYLMEAGLEVVSSTYRSSVALETNYLRRK
jgi:hypothetical protein